MVSVVAGKLEGVSLRKARVAAGLTQEELAEVIGCQHATISRWEQAEEILSPRYQVMLMNFIEMTMAGIEESA